MKWNKEKFLKTELGSSLHECIITWDHWLNQKNSVSRNKSVAWCQAQWEVYRMVVKQFYGIEYHFARTDAYFGVCTKDRADWLFKVEREVYGL